MQKDINELMKPELITLTGQEGYRVASARVLPQLGANLISFEVDGTEYIYWDEQTFFAENIFSGGFNMFPTPCRLAGCSYKFEDKEIDQKKHGEKVFIHGLIRDEAMKSRNNGDNITSWLDITSEHPVFEGFPFKCKIGITHALTMASNARRSAKVHAPADASRSYPALTVSFRLENQDACNIPFGYGLHPYWRIHGGRKDVTIRIPCDNVMEVEELVPTGEYSPVSGTDLDFRSARSLEGLNIDNTFWKRKPGDTAEITFKAINRKIIIEAGDEFTHMIAYTPVEKNYFCVENLTSSPDAPNLVSAGKEQAAHMLVVPPGGTAQSWIGYSVEPVA